VTHGVESLSVHFEPRTSRRQESLSPSMAQAPRVVSRTTAEEGGEGPRGRHGRYGTVLDIEGKTRRHQLGSNTPRHPPLEIAYHPPPHRFTPLMLFLRSGLANTTRLPNSLIAHAFKHPTRPNLVQRTLATMATDPTKYKLNHSMCVALCLLSSAIAR
jgi:hypothetical protein